jgi:YaiO family outer membrane protein
MPALLRNIAATLLVLAGGAGGAGAAPSFTVEAALGQESISGGREDWRSAEANLLWRDTAARGEPAANLALRHTERFGLEDRQVEAGGAWRFAPDWRAEAELAHSDTHRVLPEWRARGRAWWLGVGGWNLAAGGGRTLYRGAGVQGSSVAELQAERYVGAFRFLWAGSLTRPDGGGSAGAQQLRLDWYPNDDSRIGVLLAAGREPEAVPGQGVVTTRVRSLVLGARWRFHPAWSASAELGAHDVGDLYDRRGLRLGLAHHF